MRTILCRTVLASVNAGVFDRWFPMTPANLNGLNSQDILLVRVFQLYGVSPIDFRAKYASCVSKRL